MTETVKTHQPCHMCGSSNAGAVYDDNHFYCFSCRGYSKFAYLEDEDVVVEMESYKKPVSDTPWSKRNISDAVKDYYDVVASDKQVKFPYFSSAGVRVASKIRSAGKIFSTEGSFKDSVLFGMHTLNKAGSARSSTIIVTEGEADAMAAFQMANSIAPEALSISKRNAIVHAVSIKSY